MSQFKAFSTDGAAVRVVALPNHGAILTAHANGTVVVRKTSDIMSEIARKQTTEAEAPTASSPATTVLFDAVVSHAQDYLVVSVNDGGSYKVVAFDLPSLAFRSIVSTRSLPARALAVSTDDTLVAIGDDDHKVLVVRLSSVTACWVLAGSHSKLTSLTMMALPGEAGCLVGGASSDGDVRVWKVTGCGDGAVVAPLCSRTALLPAVVSEDVMKGRREVFWLPTPVPTLGILADTRVNALVPTEADPTKPTHLKQWKITPLTQEEVVVPLATTTLSHDGTVLVSADSRTQVFVWAWMPSKHQFTMKRCATVGTPVIQSSFVSNDSVVVLNAKGEVAVLSLPDLPSCDGAAVVEKDRRERSFSIGSDVDDTIAEPKVKPRRARVVSDSEPSDDEDIVEPAAQSKPSSNLSKYVDDAASVSGDDEEGEDEGGTGSVASMDPLGRVAPIDRIALLAEEIGSRVQSELNRPIVAAAPRSVVDCVSQEAFQPGSTTRPSVHDEGSHRHFLVWNRVGTVVSRLDLDETDKPLNSIDIEFADVSRSRNVKFTEQYDFVLGTLSMSGAVFASKRVDPVAKSALDVLRDDPEVQSTMKDAGRPATVAYRGFRGAFPANWQESLPMSEDAVGVACGSNWAAVGSTANTIRVFQCGGTPSAVVCVCGPIVCMAGEGPLLAVVYHRQPAVMDTQLMSVALWKLDQGGNATPFGQCDVPLRRDALLAWAGFSTNHVFMVLDSFGMLYALKQSHVGCAWSPVVDTNTVKTGDLMPWIVGVETDNILCVLCKESSPEPDANRRPVQVTLPLRSPLMPHSDLIDAAGRKAALMEAWEWCVSNGIDLFTDDSPEKTGPDGSLTTPEGQAYAVRAISDARTAMNKAILADFFHHCKAGRDARAWDLAQKLDSAVLVEKAVSMATHCKRSVLAQQLYKLRQQVETARQLDTREEHAYPMPKPSGASPGVTAPKPTVGEDADVFTERLVAKHSNGGKLASKPAASLAVSSRPTPASPPRKHATPTVNPFASSVAQSPSKRQRQVAEGLMSKSPPSKKLFGGPQLQRQSTFVHEARKKALDDIHKTA